MQSVDDAGHADAARGVGLRVKKQLGVQHVVSRSAQQIGPRQVVKILLAQEHAGTGVINIQKTLQVAEGIRTAQRVNVGVRQRHAIAGGQRKNQLRLQRAFDVNMQLGLGHLPEQSGQALDGDGFELVHGYFLEKKAAIGSSLTEKKNAPAQGRGASLHYAQLPGTLPSMPLT